MGFPAGSPYTVGVMDLYIWRATGPAVLRHRNGSLDFPRTALHSALIVTVQS